MSYVGSTVVIKQPLYLLTLAVDKKGIILKHILYEIYRVVRAAIHFERWRVYIRIYLVAALFVYGTVMGPRNP